LSEAATASAYAPYCEPKVKALTTGVVAKTVTAKRVRRDMVRAVLLALKLDDNSLRVP
jgi:hypothetical protein